MEEGERVTIELLTGFQFQSFRLSLSPFMLAYTNTKRKREREKRPGCIINARYIL